VLWPSLIMAAMALAAGICTLAPATRLLIGPGLLLGAAAGSAGWLVGLATLWVSQGGLGHGQSLQFAACSILVLAAGLVALELASTPGVGISMPSLESRLPLLVVALGAVAAVGVGINLWSLILLQGFDTEVVPNIWGIATALLVPAAAAAIAPRQLGAALLAGWIGAGPIVYVYYYVGLRVLTSHDLAPVVLAGSAVFALLLIVVRPKRLR
jgi:hypothetical protein